MSFIAIAAGVSVVGAGLKIGQGIHQNNLANSVVVPDADYKTSPYAQKMLEESERLKNARMYGASTAENNIMGNQSNTIGAVGRNSTSGAQSLAMLAAIQGQTNNSFQNLRLQEGQDQRMKENDWMDANRTMINEGDKEYQDDLRKRQEAIGEKTALRGAANQNIGGGINGIVNAGLGYASMRNPGQATKI